MVTSTCVRDGPSSLSQTQFREEAVRLVKLAQVNTNDMRAGCSCFSVLDTHRSARSFHAPVNKGVRLFCMHPHILMCPNLTDGLGHASRDALVCQTDPHEMHTVQTHEWGMFASCSVFCFCFLGGRARVFSVAGKPVFSGPKSVRLRSHRLWVFSFWTSKICTLNEFSHLVNVSLCFIGTLLVMGFSMKTQGVPISQYSRRCRKVSRLCC